MGTTTDYDYDHWATDTGRYPTFSVGVKADHVITYGTIGTQSWALNNLCVTHLRDGTKLKLFKQFNYKKRSTLWSGNTAAGYSNGAKKPSFSDWINGTIPGYAFVNDDPRTVSTYGLLYNWAAVATGLLTPTSYRVPTNTDWATLIAYVGNGFDVVGGALKSTGATWASPNTGAADSFSFAALGAGYKNYCGKHILRNTGAAFWTSTEDTADESGYRIAQAKFISGTSISLKSNTARISCGMSVRIIHT